MIRILFLLAVAVVVVTVLRALFRPRAFSLPPPDDEPTDSDEPLEPHYDGSEELVALTSTSDPVAIEAYRGALHSAGIPAVVFDEDASRMLGRIPTIAMRIMVPASRLEEARTIVEDLETMEEKETRS